MPTVSVIIPNYNHAKYRHLGGHTLVMWEAIKFFSDKVRYFNFCGSDIEPIEEHIATFGGTLTPYLHIFNDRLMWKESGIRHHLSEVSFHLHEAWKTAKKKFLKKQRPSS